MASSGDYEKLILDYWEKNNTFKKSVDQRSEDKIYHFYDGPPFATGLPHYGHIVASLMKDVVPRYWTMKGFRVERVWGWDCHGLPVENMIEKELGLKNKKDIEDFGVEKFNNACKASVLRYAEEWEKTVRRMGRWVDMKNDYKTMDNEFMESVWWVFSELWKKDLIYEGKKPMHVCPRCVTPLSNFEASLEYKEIKDISVTAKFQIKEELNGKKVNALAWTTTPWTLPGNLLLAIGEKLDYAVIQKDNEYYLMAKVVAEKKGYEIKEVIKGKELIGKTYKPLFPYFKNNKNSFKIVKGEFVNTEEGTGIVHIAPAFGQDDYELGREHNVEWQQHLTMDGKFTSDVKDFAGLEVKPKENPIETDIQILKWLKENNSLFEKLNYKHSYPHCWRCDTPLLNYATNSWFVNIAKIKPQLIKNNQKINWVPEHIKKGRFGKWLDNAKDWSISRNRFWGAPLPIWRSEDGDTICLSSIKELEELSGKKVKDLHKHVIDEITFKKNGKEYKRIEEVLDCWFESGSMPYAQFHYPFENKDKFEKGFPANFIAEGQDQTRGWFYTLHVLSTALTSGKKSIPVKESVPAFKNVIVNGMVLASDGKKMSKKLKNYPAPDVVINKYGADALRYYLVSSPVMHAQTLNFSEEGVREIYNKYVNTLNNVLNFYKMFSVEKQVKSEEPLDIWILSKLEGLRQEVMENMEVYKLAEATKPLLNFIADLSQWYVRRSRERFKTEQAGKASYTLKKVLTELSKIIAPFTPFIAEHIWKGIGEKKSVHLTEWPTKIIDRDLKLEEQMDNVRDAVTKLLDAREKNKLPVRQVVKKVIVKGNVSENLKNLIQEEINTKEVIIKKGEELEVELDTKLTPELIREGIVRELVRKINKIRKDMNLTIEDRINLGIKADNEVLKSVNEHKEYFMSNVQADKILSGGDKEIQVKNYKVLISIDLV